MNTRIPYGQEKRFNGPLEPERCHDCEVLRGELHIAGCDVEECENCGRQRISCPCNEKDE